MTQNYSGRLQIIQINKVGKCKFIHIGHGNMDEDYTIGDAVLGRTTQERDFGVLFCGDMNILE